MKCRKASCNHNLDPASGVIPNSPLRFRKVPLKDGRVTVIADYGWNRYECWRANLRSFPAAFRLRRKARRYLRAEGLL